MRGGKCDTRAVLLRATETGRDGLNRPVIEFVPAAPAFWVQQMQQRPIEAWKAGQSAAQLECAFRCRWSPTTAGISPRDRLLVDGVTYDVVGNPAEPQRRQEIVITCTSIVNPEG